MNRYCVSDGSGNPTLLGVDCSEQRDPWGTPKKNASKLMNAFLYNFILVSPLGAKGLSFQTCVQIFSIHLCNII